MKEYNYYSGCRRCGYYPKDFKANTVAADTEYKLGTFDDATQKCIHIEEFGIKPEEYLLRTCRRCGFKWAEKCLEDK